MGCQSTLLRLVEDWRKALDSHKYVAAIQPDLTKALDCLPHSLLLGKLSACGLSDIEIDHSLTFNTHFANICKKAAIHLAILKRLGHLLTRQGKLAIFKSFITSNFNYCPLIWHFLANLPHKKFKREHFVLFTMIIHPRIKTF